jgi:hypothetical protein
VSKWRGTQSLQAFLAGRISSVFDPVAKGARHKRHYGRLKSVPPAIAELEDLCEGYAEMPAGILPSFWSTILTPTLLPTGLFGRVSVDVHHALNLVTTCPASKNLSLVIEVVIGIRAASR